MTGAGRLFAQEIHSLTRTKQPEVDLRGQAQNLADHQKGGGKENDQGLLTGCKSRPRGTRGGGGTTAEKSGLKSVRGEGAFPMAWLGWKHALKLGTLTERRLVYDQDPGQYRHKRWAGCLDTAGKQRMGKEAL